MASFEEQIEGLTSIDIDESSTPTQTEVIQFLSDGVRDVVNMVLKYSPDEIYLFTTTDKVENSDGLAVESGVVDSVTRADGNGNLRNASLIPSSLRYLSTEEDSLYFRSKFNAAYYWQDGKVFILPAPSNNTTDRGEISYVTYDDPPYNESKIADFPEKYYYLVVLYAAAKVIEAKMASYTVDDEDRELVLSYTNNLASLKQQYLSSFGVKAEANIGKTEEELES